MRIMVNGERDYIKGILHEIAPLFTLSGLAQHAAA